MTDHSNLMTYMEAAERLGVRVGTLYGWVSNNRIPAVRFGPRCVRFDPDTLDAWVEAHRVNGKEVAR